MTKIFVYGTLRSGECRGHVVEGCINHGEFKTEPRYTLLDFGPFPGIKDGGDTAIVGEVVEVDDETLDILDNIEGHPNFYRRAYVHLEGMDGVMTYFAPASQINWGKPIESGDWLAREKQ